MSEWERFVRDYAIFVQPTIITLLWESMLFNKNKKFHWGNFYKLFGKTILKRRETPVNDIIKACLQVLIDQVVEIEQALEKVNQKSKKNDGSDLMSPRSSFHLKKEVARQKIHELTQMDNKKIKKPRKNSNNNTNENSAALALKLQQNVISNEFPDRETVHSIRATLDSVVGTQRIDITKSKFETHLAMLHLPNEKEITLKKQISPFFQVLFSLLSFYFCFFLLFFCLKISQKKCTCCFVEGLILIDCFVSQKKTWKHNKNNQKLY